MTKTEVVPEKLGKCDKMLTARGQSRFVHDRLIFPLRDFIRFTVNNFLKLQLFLNCDAADDGSTFSRTLQLWDLLLSMSM